MQGMIRFLSSSRVLNLLATFMLLAVVLLVGVTLLPTTISDVSDNNHGTTTGNVAAGELAVELDFDNDSDKEGEEEILLTVSRSQLRRIVQDFVADVAGPDADATAGEGQNWQHGNNDIDFHIEALLQKVEGTCGDGVGGECQNYGGIASSSFEGRIVEQLLGIYNNPDCIDYELDLSKINEEADDDNDDDEDEEDEDAMSKAAKNARRIFQKCRILVLRNVFPTTTTTSVAGNRRVDEDDDDDKEDDDLVVDLTKFSEFVETAPDDEGGTTTYGGDFYILKEDVDRFNYMLPRHLVISSPSIFGNEFIINHVLGHPAILGGDMILNHAGVIHAMPMPKNNGNHRMTQRRPQYWHMDGSFVHENEDIDKEESNDSDDENGDDENHRLNHRRHSPVVSGHELPPFAVNMFTPVNVDVRIEHGPTDFCIGTSLFRGLKADHMDRLYDHVATIITLKQQQQQQHSSSISSNSNDDIEELKSILRLIQFEWNIHYDHHDGYINMKSKFENNDENANHCPKGFSRTPLLNRGDLLLFDYMVTHRGGMNVVEDVARQLLFGMYSRPWYRDTTFDGDYSNGSSSYDDDDDDLDNCEYHEAGLEYDYFCELKSLTKMTRFAVLPTIANQTTASATPTTPSQKKKQRRQFGLLEAKSDEATAKTDEL